MGLTNSFDYAKIGEVGKFNMDFAESMEEFHKRFYASLSDDMRLCIAAGVPISTRTDFKEGKYQMLLQTDVPVGFYEQHDGKRVVVMGRKTR